MKKPVNIYIKTLIRKNLLGMVNILLTFQSGKTKVNLRKFLDRILRKIRAKKILRKLNYFSFLKNFSKNFTSYFKFVSNMDCNHFFPHVNL